jgi:excisionase family DNA binding protein
MTDRLPSLLTIPETAAELRVSDDTVYRLIADGSLDAVDVSGRDSRRAKTRVPRESIETFIKARRRNSRSGRKNNLRIA